MVLVERRRDGLHYFVVPGGGVEPGESFEQAAVREAREELGIEVALDGPSWKLAFGGRHVYFSARVAGGEVSERFFDEQKDAGMYRPVWVPLGELASIDVRPPELRGWLRGTPRSRPPSRRARPT